MLLVLRKPLWVSMMSVEDSRRPLIILSMFLQTQLINAIGRLLFGSLESFPGLAIGMMIASVQKVGNICWFPNIVKDF